MKQQLNEILMDHYRDFLTEKIESLNTNLTERGCPGDGRRVKVVFTSTFVDNPLERGINVEVASKCGQWESLNIFPASIPTKYTSPNSERNEKVIAELKAAV